MKQTSLLCSRIGYTFNDFNLLNLALTHRSVSGQTNNERLEFLGDSVLNLIIGGELFTKFPQGKEGQLSRLRASLVRGETLAQIGGEFGLGEFLILGPGEHKSGGARRESTLADAVEAIIGAIFCESGYNEARKVVLRWFDSRIQALTLNDTVKDNKTRLQEILQHLKMGLPEYRILSVSGSSHQQVFQIECAITGVEERFAGSGLSRRQAEQQAAGFALASLSVKYKSAAN
ncbi:Ribonuclease III [gamma proteobacterium HdN1]|nr:Ribonuclease III [gamma proteobacterium HdN1]